MSERKRTEESCKKFYQILTSERQTKRLKKAPINNNSSGNNNNNNNGNNSGNGSGSSSGSDIVIKQWLPNRVIEDCLQKLDTRIGDLITVVENMSSDIKELKESNEKILHSIKKLENASKGVDEEFINYTVTNVVKLITKVSMYSSKKELRGTTEVYFKENHPEFYNNFLEICWFSYFTVNIYPYGTLTFKAKDTLFSYFGESELPAIKTSAIPTKIARWKKTKEISSCYKKLFNLSGDKKSDLVLTKIIKKIFPKKEDSVPNVQLAFVIVICVTILNPKHASIKLDKVALKNKVEYYLNKFEFKELIGSNDVDDISEDGGEVGKED